MGVKIVSCLGPGGWEEYGQRFVKSFREHWPTETRLEIWTHDLVEQPTYEGVTFKKLDDTDAFQKLKAHLGSKAKDGPSLQYSFKAVALAHAAEQDLDWLAFLDADTETMHAPQPHELAQLFDTEFDAVYLYRRVVQESEGSFIAFNLRSPQGASLLNDFFGLYATGEFLHYKKAHDNSVLDRLVTLHTAHGLKVKDLSNGCLGLDAFHQSPLGAFMIHYKGPDKNKIADPALMQPGRYTILCDIVRQALNGVETPRIAEVGTWNGTRAVQMAEAVFAAGHKSLFYLGFDTFDAGNDRELEGHTKEHARADVVAGRLLCYGEYCRRKGLDFQFSLVEGDSRETLKQMKFEGGLDGLHFAYIDGGHSYETVKSDYENLSHVPFIVFDDIIPGTTGPEGPRKVWDELSGMHKNLVNTMDGYIGADAPIHYGVLTREGLTPPVVQTQIRVKPLESRDVKEQYDSIKANSQTLKKWPEMCQAHDGTALLVSAGPTLASFFEDIRQKQAAGATVFAVKHALPKLKAAGIRPDYTVLLDPRPVTGTSTHGVVRKDLFKEVDSKDKFLVATMTDPSVLAELKKKKATMYGWHAFTQTTMENPPPEFKTGLVVGGGTCSATRMPMLAYTFGFRRFEFYGYDFYYPSDTDVTKLSQKTMEVSLGTNPRKLLTTGELIAAMQDLGTWNKWLIDNKLSVKWHGDGAGAILWEQATQGKYKEPAEWPI